MAKHDFLQPDLIGLARLQIALDNKGGPSEDGQLFEQILELHDSILKSFGLPVSPDNEKLLWFKTIPTDIEVNERIKLLHQTATKYLLSNAKPELQMLRDALELKQNAFVILPELKISTHTYTIFVYEKIFLKRKDTPENILHELKFVNHPDILDALGRLGIGTLENEPAVVSILKAVGVKYIDQFIMHNSNLLSDDDY